MQQTNNPARYIGITSLRSSESEYHAITGNAIATRARKNSTAVPSWMVEAENEGCEIDGQRHYPQKRQRGNVLADMVGHRKQQERRHCPQCKPHQLLPKTRLYRVCVASSRRHGNVHLVGVGIAYAQNGGADTKYGEYPVEYRPRYRLHGGRDPWALSRPDKKAARAMKPDLTARTAGTAPHDGSATRTTTASAGWLLTAGNTATR